MAIGAAASTGVGLLHASSSLPIYAVMAVSALAGLTILLICGKQPENQRS
jgi:hypothetical protein